MDREWKRIPAAATPEMVEAAEEAYVPFGDMELALNAALGLSPAPAAQAVNTPPVAWLIDWPSAPDLGHYIGEEPNRNARSRPLYMHPAAEELADAERYRLLRKKVCIVGASFHIINLSPRYVAPRADIELDAAIDAARTQETSK